MRGHVRYFSVAYRPLEWPLPDWMEVVSTAPAGAGVTDLSETCPEFARRDPVLGEYATLFAVRRLLEEARERGESSGDDMVGISHYRRFAVTRPTGKSSYVYGAVTPREFARLPRELFVPKTGTVLFPSPVRVGPTVLGQFAQYHHTRDLLHFMALAIDLGIVTNEQATEWLAGQVLVPAAAIGVYPEDWLVRTLTDLETVVDAFESTAAVPRDGYQRRTVAFCLERLHGLLLSGLIEQCPEDGFISHPALLVSPDGVYHPGGESVPDTRTHDQSLVAPRDGR
jgi:hypothetical protein